MHRAEQGILNVPQHIHVRLIEVPCRILIVLVVTALGHVDVIVSRLAILVVLVAEANLIEQLGLGDGAEAAWLGVDTGNQLGEVLGLAVGDGVRPQGERRAVVAGRHGFEGALRRYLKLQLAARSGVEVSCRVAG